METLNRAIDDAGRYREFADKLVLAPRQAGKRSGALERMAREREILEWNLAVERKKLEREQRRRLAALGRP